MYVVRAAIIYNIYFRNFNNLNLKCNTYITEGRKVEREESFDAKLDGLVKNLQGKRLNLKRECIQCHNIF